MKIIKSFRVKQEDLPAGWSKQAVLFINKCLRMNPKQRLGYAKGTEELKQHAWFKDFDWKALEQRRMIPPFRPINVYHPRMTHHYHQQNRSRIAQKQKMAEEYKR